MPLDNQRPVAMGALGLHTTWAIHRLLDGYSAALNSAMNEVRLGLTPGALGLDTTWAQRLYYDPMVVLLEPDGGMRTILTHKGISTASMLGNIMRNLHLAVPELARDTSAAEDEATRQAMYNDHVAWAEVLKEDETLRQPTSFWFDGLFDGPAEKKRPMLAGANNAALPA